MMELGRNRVRVKTGWMDMNEHRSRQVVIIDDDEAVLESFRFWLEATGLPVATYPSAIAYLDDGKACPRCLILDQNMPRMTGLDLAARLQSRGVAVPILLITSSVSPDLIARAAALGIARVMEKPPAEDELLAFVAACDSAPSPRPLEPGARAALEP